jgi:hypothetical protein
MIYVAYFGFILAHRLSGENTILDKYTECTLISSKLHIFLIYQPNVIKLDAKTFPQILITIICVVIYVLEQILKLYSPHVCKHLTSKYTAVF